jgi:hypothetical protein
MPLLSRAKFHPVNALLLSECKVIPARGGTHLVLLFRSGEQEHSFALSLDDARTLIGGVERALAEADGA